ncbi:MAG: N-acetyltransferase [Mangrovicoccus sp.]|nr:N-acetyltransferase [Mangrovicoccus sp.]
MISIRPATPDDYLAVSVLVVSAFGQPNEERMIEALRAGGHVACELVAVKDDEVVGYICFSRFNSPEGWVALAPVCVRTPLQGKGIGAELVRYGLDAVRQDQAKAVIVVGGPEYYARFGFVFDGPAKLDTIYPQQFTGIYPIAPETASAEEKLVYPAPFEEV